MNPDSYTIAEHMLDVGDGHTLYVQDWGNPSAEKPIIFLHGGPGSSVKDKYRAMFNPVTQRVIFFDQRGGGKSTPSGEFRHNTTQDLSDDIIRIADFLQIKKYLVTGYSWGSTLALYHAIAQPERVLGLMIGGIFTGSKQEIDWLDSEGIRMFYPDAWREYETTVPDTERTHPTKYHISQALSNDAGETYAAAYAYASYTSRIVALNDAIPPIPHEVFDPAGVLIELRYIAEGCFMPDGYLLKNAHKITVPVHIVQGRYDMLCPPATAHAVHQAIPQSTMTWVTSGHAGEHETITAQKLIMERLTA